MFRAASLCALLCLATLSFAQTPSGNAANSTTPLQLVYVIDGSILTTYNVNSQTLQAAQAGTTTVQQSVYPNLITSPNGHAIYYTAYQNVNQQGQRLYVYGTNNSGVPISPPIQSISAQNLFSPLVDPTNMFLYLVHQGTIGQYTNYTIIRYMIDPTTGKITQPVTEAKYRLNTNALYCWLFVFGMHAGGTKLYDQISCGYPHGGSRASYFERTVDPQTGALGPDQQIYSWDNASGCSHGVEFVKNLLFDFAFNNLPMNDNNVGVDPLQPNFTRPVISCDSSMLADCSSFSFGLAHPSAQYVFMGTPQTYMTNIDKVDLSAKKIVATGNTIPYEVQQFSPDGKIVYAANDVSAQLHIQIYGFNASNAQVTAGGLISVPSDLDSWFAAERR